MADAYNSMLLKKETVYGTDSVPTAAANAFLTRNLQVKPLAVDQKERNLDIPARGARPKLPTNKRMEGSFEVELAGSGAAGTAPAWMEALEICGMEPAVLTATVDAKQKFAALSATLSSATVHNYRGSNQRRRGRGARGDITTIDFTAGEYPFIGISYTALLNVAPFDQVALVNPVFTRWRDPVEVNTANTTFTLDGFAAILRSIKFKANGEIALRNLVGANYVRRGNHAMEVSIMIEAPDHNTKNYLALLESGSTVACQITHGIGAGNIVQISAANLQITDISDAEESDIAMYDISATLTISAGQDDILITAR